MTEATTEAAAEKDSPASSSTGSASNPAPSGPKALFYAWFEKFSGKRHALIGAALTRILLGAAGLYFYLRDYSDRSFLWGPEAVWPWQNFIDADDEAFSLYALSKSETWFQVVFHAGAVAALLFMLGWKTRVMTVVHYVFLWSLQQRNPLLLDGGDNATVIVLVFILFVDCGSRFSLDARARRRKKPARTSPASGSMRYRIGSLLHHAGLLAVILQVCTIYLVSGMYKVQGDRWQNGTALYYILRGAEFGWPGVNHFLYEHATLVVAMTYGTVFFQLGFSFLLLKRGLRPFAVACGVLLHLGIAIHMAGLITFSLTMIALELVIMGDEHYRRLAGAARALAAKFGGRLPTTHAD
ncbi:HTTM domain-containing protein [Streptomyces hiroshimensis]|uniref:HTTM domain-containing protein n=2 Tax=Streptomyces hiroshimensis TaxID=66424 RepID=A0ABQ2YLZ6_9ACTN|nr:HTTM domain-containing protein [Streptomyces hiroshimensis]